MPKKYKVRETYRIRKIGGYVDNYSQYGITIPTSYIPDWSGADVTITESGLDCLVIVRQ